MQMNWVNWCKESKPNKQNESKIHSHTTRVREENEEMNSDRNNNDERCMQINELQATNRNEMRKNGNKR